MNTNFNLRNKKSKNETLIFLVLRWNNCKLVYSTKESIKPKFWEVERKKRNFQRAKEVREFPEHPEFNARLDIIASSANNVYRKYLNDNNNRQPSVLELKELLDIKIRNVKQKQEVGLFEFIKQFILEAHNRFNIETGKPLAKGTIGIYSNTLKTLKQYSKQKRKRVCFDTIDIEFYHEYVEYLSKEMNLSNNTVGRHIKTIKSFLNDAAERGLHKNFAFRSKKFKVLAEVSDEIYLNESELAEFYNLDLSANVKLERVRDLFLVACWTGLRFSDFTSIQKENIHGDFLEIRTKKTDETVVIPIHPTVKLIMEKYKGKYSNSLPPSFSNVETNKYLKIIGERIKSFHEEVKTGQTKGGVYIISTNKKFELIKTHTGRRSFATNLYKSGLQSITIMKITGHRTEKAFLRYIKVTPNENAKLLKKHWENIEKLKSKPK